MILPDSGERREFPTGAVRDIAQGKGRCDLLPLDVLGAWTGDEILPLIDAYLNYGETVYLEEAMGKFIDSEYNRDIYTAILEVAKHFEDGAVKYGDNNWQKGIYLHCYIDSAVRHYLKYRRGDRDEPHDRAFMWNLICAIWTHKNKPEMIDILRKGERYAAETATSTSENDMIMFIGQFCAGRRCGDCPLHNGDVACISNDPKQLKDNYNKAKEYLANESNTDSSNT